MEEVKKIREFVARFRDVDGLDDDAVIAEFNDMLAEQGKPYWFCPKCFRFHPREWVRCDLPSTMYEESRQITEEEWEELNFLFDPSDYKMDPYHIQFPHSRIRDWLDEAEDRYNTMIKNLVNLKLVHCCELWGVKGGININDLSCPMTIFEQALRKFEIQRYRGVPTNFKNLDELLDFYIEHTLSP
ncbi:MAG: hypothetical protein N2V72_00035 [Methanophagales archaeon]|nr:hypothetical protein [Methanophagales archaeon]